MRYKCFFFGASALVATITFQVAVVAQSPLSQAVYKTTELRMGLLHQEARSPVLSKDDRLHPTALGLPVGGETRFRRGRES